MNLCIRCNEREVSPDYAFHCDPCAEIAEDEFIAAGGDELLVRLAEAEMREVEATDGD